MHLSSLNKKLTSDALWAFAGQALSAIGVLLGIRLLTEYLPPERFGELILQLGVAALLLALVSTPVLQAALRYYPELLKSDGERALRKHISGQLCRVLGWAFAVLVPLGIGVCLYLKQSPVIVLLLALVVIVDIARAYEMAFLNAARLQRRYAIWSAAEAFARPLLAVSAIFFFGVETWVVLLAYFFASALLWFFLKKPPARQQAQGVTKTTHFDKTIWRYALPLVPLALIGWVSGLGDRYIIGIMLSLNEAGIYAAAYGLISRPFLIGGKIVELVMRPVYQQAVSDNDNAQANKIFQQWLLVVFVLMLLGVLFVGFFNQQIAALLLGEAYRKSSHLMIWIAAGYAFLTVSYVFERVCYACDKTSYVLFVQAIGAVTGLCATVIAIYKFGLTGAAMAVPAYFGIQLLASIVAAAKTVKSPIELEATTKFS